MGYPVDAVCKLLHVSRSAYNKWVAGKLSRGVSENEQIAEKIEKIHAESPDKGYRRINDVEKSRTVQNVNAQKFRLSGEAFCGLPIHGG